MEERVEDTMHIGMHGRCMDKSKKPMKTQTNIAQFIAPLAALGLFITPLVHADGVPEPGLVLYGKVRNAAAANAVVTQGTLTLTVQQVGGASVVVSTPVLPLPPGQSFRARVPFEVLLGSAATLSAGTFKIPTSTLAFQITQAIFTHPSIGTTNLPLGALSVTSFNLAGNFRGEVRAVDVQLSDPRINLAAWIDSDGGGMSDADELLAGTDPHDPTSNLALTIVWSYLQKTAYLQWSSVIGRRYSILRSTSGVGGEFAVLDSNLLATGSTSVIVDTAATTSITGFYRVRLDP